MSGNADIGDYLALMTLNVIAENINSLYDKTHCKIFSDGFAFRIDEHDAPDEEILEYHDQLNSLTTIFFPHVSFVSWQVSEAIDSYKDLQSKVSDVPLPPEEVNEKDLQHMSAFVSEEFNCAYWKDIFLEKAKLIYVEQGIVEKKKKHDQKVSTIRNALMKEKAESVSIELFQKIKQFSLFFKSLEQYHGCVNLCVSNKGGTVDIATSSLPINLIYGHPGSPWYNAIVVDEEKQEFTGLFKDVFNKKACLLDHEKNSWSVKTEKGECLLLEYIKTSSQ